MITRIEVYRHDYTASVLLLKHKAEESYSFVNLTKGHICPCRFATIDEAIADLEKQKKEGRVLSYDIIKYDNIK